MPVRLTDPPQRPFPSQQSHTPQVQQPMIYVYEKQRWEYKVVVTNAIDEELPSEEELNTLGVKGWELVGAVALPRKIQLYFKRAQT